MIGDLFYSKTPLILRNTSFLKKYKIAYFELPSQNFYVNIHAFKDCIFPIAL